MASLRQAKDCIHADATLNHEHLPLAGHSGLLRVSQKLMFGTTRDLGFVATLLGRLRSRPECVNHFLLLYHFYPLMRYICDFLALPEPAVVRLSVPLFRALVW
jgi:hypothetical protein